MIEKRILCHERVRRIGGGFAYKHGHGVFHLGALQAEVKRLGLGALELGFRLEHIRFGCYAAIVPVICQFEGLPVIGYS